MKNLLVPALMVLFFFGSSQMSVLKEGYWSHWESDNCDFNCRIEKYEVLGQVEWAGEVLYKGNTCDIRYAIELWEKSESHKRVLDEDYDTGIMLISKENNTCYIVFDVGKR
jgi:uncharacterized protein YkwD